MEGGIAFEASDVIVEANAQEGLRPPLRRQAAHVRAYPLLAASALFVLTMTAVVVTMNTTVNLYDEGLALVGSERVLAGDIPYRDFYANYGPGLFAVIAGLFKLFGPYVIVARAWDVFVRAATVSIVYLLTCRASRPIALAAAMLSAYWMTAFGFYLYPQFPALCASLASVALLRPTLEGEAAPKRLVAAGFMAALPAMFQYEIGAGTIAVECLELVGLALFLPVQRRRYREFLATIFGFLAGVSLVLAPWGMWLAVTGALPGFVLDVVKLAGRGYAAMRRLPLPGLSNPSNLSVYQPFVVFVACMPTVLFLASRRTNQARRELALLAQIALLTLLFFAKGWVRIDVAHMSGAIICSIVLLALTFPRARTLGGLAKTPLLVAAALSLLFALTVAKRPLYATLANVSWLAAGHSCQPQAGAERAACLQVPPEEAAASALVQQLTRPGEPVFVGLGRHDKIVVDNVLLYFLSDRPSATAWHQMDPGVQTTMPVQQQIVDELRRECVRVVVLDTQWDAVNEPNTSAISSGVTLLDDMIRHDYVAVQSFGTLTVMQVRKGMQRPHCAEAAEG